MATAALRALSGASPVGPVRRASRDLLRLEECAGATLVVLSLAVPSFLGSPMGAGFLPAASALVGSAVAIGAGMPFFRGALASMQSGELDFEIPLATTMLLALAGSLAAWSGRPGEVGFFGPVATFCTLMLAGRVFRARTLEANRQLLREGADASGRTALVVCDGRVESVALAAVRPGATLLVRPGDFFPADAVVGRGGLEARGRRASADAVRPFSEGERVPAGSVLAGDRAVTVTTVRGESSQSRPRPDIGSAPPRPGWSSSPRAFPLVVVGLGVAAAGFGFLVALAPSSAMSALLAALLIVCPCAIGFAVPLGDEVTLAELRAAGVFVRSPDFLARAGSIRHLVFDKTGTLTPEHLDLVSPTPLAALSKRERGALWNLAVRSSHPKARAVAAVLGAEGHRFDPRMSAREIPGQGLEAVVDGATFRLGSAAFAGYPCASCDLVATRDGMILALLPTQEIVRDDVPTALAALERAGYTMHLVSGDRVARTRAFGGALGFAKDRVHGDATPERKAEYIGALRGPAMMIGDSPNDTAAMSAASASTLLAEGTPLLSSPADCHIQGPLGAGLLTLLARATRVRTVLREGVALGVLGAVLVVVAGALGHASPLGLALAMPASALLVALWVAVRLRGAPNEQTPRQGVAPPLLLAAAVIALFLLVGIQDPLRSLAALGLFALACIAGYLFAR